MQEALLRIFARWGTPDAIKVDNGRPFGDPANDVPPVLALWLIGSGIEVIWNRPRCPTDNAKVERMQGVSANWSEPEHCTSIQHLQRRLDEATAIQRAHYPVRRLAGRTRLERYPDLEHIVRPYTPGSFSTERILAFLAQGNWVRKVAESGQTSFFRQRWQIGCAHKREYVCIHLDLEQRQWIIATEQGKQIKCFAADFLTAEHFWFVSVDQRTAALAEQSPKHGGDLGH